MDSFKPYLAKVAAGASFDELAVAIIAGAIRSALERVAVAPADAARVRDEVETFVLRALLA